MSSSARDGHQCPAGAVSRLCSDVVPAPCDTEVLLLYCVLMSQLLYMYIQCTTEVLLHCVLMSSSYICICTDTVSYICIYHGGLAALCADVQLQYNMYILLYMYIHTVCTVCCRHGGLAGGLDCVLMSSSSSYICRSYTVYHGGLAALCADCVLMSRQMSQLLYMYMYGYSVPRRSCCTVC